MINLSPSQEEARDAFQSFLMDEDKKELVISGFAGSGKSFLMRYLEELAYSQFVIEKNMDKNFREMDIYFTATTNKAAGVLADMTNRESQTIHSFLGLQPVNDFKTGKVKLKTTDRTMVMDSVLVFIDEASMISKQLLQIIRECLVNESTNSKVVYVGDSYQLPPVMESHSPVFVSVKDAANLREIQRQAAQNPIIQASAKFRQVLDDGYKGSWPELPVDDVHIFHLDKDEMRNEIDAKFKNNPSPLKVKVLGYTNERVIEYNRHIRKLYTPHEEFVPGEYVITNKPVMRGRRILLHTDSFVQIKSMSETESSDGLKGWIVGLGKASVFLPKDHQEYRQLLKTYVRRKDWTNYFRVKDTYADLRPAHALTCHKSQGSTYEEVFVDMGDIGRNMKWTEIARLMYVAMSRASKRVYLYGKLPLRGWTA